MDSRCPSPRWTPSTLLLLAVSLWLFAGCNGGSVSQGAATGPTATLGETPAGGRRSVEQPLLRAPVISNLVVAFSQPCTIPREDGSVSDGTLRAVRFSYSDADGDLVGGSVVRSGTFLRGRVVLNVTENTFPIPSQRVTITGTTRGTVTFLFCTRFGTSTAVMETVQLIDAAGLRSNTLSRTVTRPPRAPEVRRPGEASPLEAIREAHPD